MTNQIKPNALIKLKTFDLFIGIDPSDVAIVSQSSGNICKLSQMSRSPKLKKARRELRDYINSNEIFTFSYMSESQTQKLISILNK